LNILVKYVRLYGFDHKRTEDQFQVAWSELRAALPASGNAGFLLGVSGMKLLVDGVPLETGQAERGFAQLLTAAGLTSIHFSARVTTEDFTRLIRAFAAGGSKAQAVAEQVKAALGDGSSGNIKINQIKFVAADPMGGEMPLAAQMAAQNLGPEFKEWLQNPQKLLQLMAAAEGAKAGAHSGAAVQSAAQATAPAYAPLQDEEVVQGIRLLTKFGQIVEAGEAEPDPKSIELDQTPDNVKARLQQLLENIATDAPGASHDDAPLLMKAAEQLAIKYALERYERGEVRVNAVHEMMERMSRQMDTLREVLKFQEERLSKAGMLVESHADILDRLFWAEVPEAGKRSVLMSPEAACVPPRNVRSYVEQLLERGQQDAASDVLRNYCGCLTHGDNEVQRKAATGLSQLADLYAVAGGDLLAHAIDAVSDRMVVEGNGEAESLLSAAFVRLGQEAVSRRVYGPVKQLLITLTHIERKRPVLAQDLRPRLGIEHRLPEFVEEAVELAEVPEELVEVLREAPKAAAEHIADRFARTRTCHECDRLVALMDDVGDDGAQWLRETLRMGAVQKSSTSVGLLSRINFLHVLELLPGRLREWNRFYHDVVVRQIAQSNALERGQILLEILPALDPMLVTVAIDEIGLSGDPAMGPALLEMLTNPEKERSDFTKLKLVEALGRLRERGAEPALRRIVEERKVWKWIYPREMRIAAAQSLTKVDPEFSPQVLSAAGFSPEELSLVAVDADPEQRWSRTRKYQRFLLDRSLPAVASSSWGKAQLAVRQLSLGGGLANKDDKMRLGTDATLDIQTGLRHIRSQVLLRRNRQGEISFEFVVMDLEERTKLRRLLLDLRQPTALPSMNPGPVGN